MNPQEVSSAELFARTELETQLKVIQPDPARFRLCQIVLALCEDRKRMIARAEDIGDLLYAVLHAAGFGLRRKEGAVWFTYSDAGAIGGYRNQRGQALGYDWVVETPDDGTGFPVLSDELRKALSADLTARAEAAPSNHTTKEPAP